MICTLLSIKWVELYPYSFSVALMHGDTVIHLLNTGEHLFPLFPVKNSATMNIFAYAF